MAMVEYDVAKANPMSISKTVTSVSDTYSVDNMKTVIEFTEYNKDCSKKCKKECCKDKTNAAKKSCAKSKACEKKCKKKCSSKKA
jgi:Cu+-exporting ATPase